MDPTDAIFYKLSCAVEQTRVEMRNWASSLSISYQGWAQSSPKHQPNSIKPEDYLILQEQNQGLLVAIEALRRDLASAKQQIQARDDHLRTLLINPSGKLETSTNAATESLEQPRKKAKTAKRKLANE
jgi:hypothetical protein